MFGIDLEASVDTLEQGLLAREAMIAALRCQQADILRTLDVTDVRNMDGAASLEEWTRSRLDVLAITARDLVDATRSFGEQPSIVDVAEAGNISFDRLVATSRLVASGADEDTVEHSFGLDLPGVARLRNLRRRMTAATSDRYSATDASICRRHWMAPVVGCAAIFPVSSFVGLQGAHRTGRHVQ